MCGATIADCSTQVAYRQVASLLLQAAAADGRRWKYEAEKAAAELAATSISFSDALAASEAKVDDLQVRFNRHNPLVFMRLRHLR